NVMICFSNKNLLSGLFFLEDIKNLCLVDITKSRTEIFRDLKVYFKNKGEIPQDKLKTIFDKFSRLDEARQSSTGGAGLGLAIAKDIIALHNGTIYAHSKEGHTIITIELPNGE
ncbi:MAG: ATP-binding protein, partial [Oscillospiraceae bacterium]